MEKRIAPGDALYTATVYTGSGGTITIDHGLPVQSNAARYSLTEAKELIEALQEGVIEIEGLKFTSN